MTAPRVFISYSHDSDAHKQQVVDLANRLRELGIDAWIDRYSPPPPEGWQVWIERQIEAASWIILVCTETYRRRFDLQEDHGKGRGVAYEANIIRSQIYESAGKNLKAIPVLFRTEDEQHIPQPLLTSSRYLFPAECDRLLRHLRGEPEILAPPLGAPQQASAPTPAALPPIHVQSPGAPDAPLATKGSDSKPSPSTKVVVRTPRPRTKRVLIVSASPRDAARLALGKEMREISQLLRHASVGRYQVRMLPAATERDFRDEMLAMKPDILHFCGHGAASGILLEKEDGQAEVISGEALVDWLKVVIKSQKRRLELAVVNFCYSQKMLTELADIADVVIGPTTEAVTDWEAVTFSTGFYMGLASGCTGAFSYHLGCGAIEMTTSSEQVPMGIYGIRCRITSDAEITTARQPALTLAFLASEPANAARLRLDRELRGIHQAVQGKELCIEPRWATRVPDFLRTLIDTRPTIVHLTGHGQGDGAFLFETDHDSQSCQAPSQALAKMLTLFHANIRCAVLLFDSSSKVAEQVADVLDYVISVSGVITDETCLKFSEVFYQLVANKLSYWDSFHATIGVLRGRVDADRFSIQGRCVSRADRSVGRMTGMTPLS